MIQQTFRGPSAQAFLSHLCPTSLASLQPYTSSLSVLLNESGGIIDDMIVTKHANDNEFYVVTNAGRAKEDGEWFSKQLREWNATEGKGKEVEWNKLEGYGLIALQGESPISGCLARPLIPVRRSQGRRSLAEPHVLRRVLTQVWTSRPHGYTRSEMPRRSRRIHRRGRF